MDEIDKIGEGDVAVETFFEEFILNDSPERVVLYV